MMSKRVELKGSKKYEIRLCALEAFSDTGYFHTSIEDIARNSNVSKGLIHHYDSKETLFKEVVLECLDRILNYFPNNKEKEFNDDSMDYFINRTIITSLNKDILCWKVLILLLSEVQLYDFGTKYLSKSSTYKEYEKAIVNYFLLKEYQKPEIEAKFFTSSLVGICIQYIINPTDYPVKSILSRFADRVCASNNKLRKKPGKKN